MSDKMFSVGDRVLANGRLGKIVCIFANLAVIERDDTREKVFALTQEMEHTDLRVFQIEIKQTNPEYDEPILADDYPVNAGYWYVINGTPTTSDVSGTVRDLKRDYFETYGIREIEVRRCDAIRRNLLMYAFA